MRSNSSLLSRLGLSLLSALLCGAVNHAQAQTLTLTGLSGSSVLVSPGGSFSFSVYLDAPATSTVGLSYFLETTGASSGNFRITARDTTGSTFSQLTSDNATVLQAGSALLAPRNGSDLGGLVADVTLPNAPTTANNPYFVATYTVQALASLPASSTFTLFASSNSIVTDDGFNDVPLTSNSFTVATTPEPSSLALLLGFGVAGSLVALRRRK